MSKIIVPMKNYTWNNNNATSTKLFIRKALGTTDT